MKLSIIIPAYNVEQFLPKCLDSIFEQNCSDFEVVVVNDGSNDGTLALLEGYAGKHSNLNVITQDNAGMSTARNRGLEVAQGEYVMFVDSDDWLCDNALSSLYPYLNGEDVVCFNAKKYVEDKDVFVENNRPFPNRVMSGWDYFNNQRLIPAEIHFVCVWQRAYRREFLDANNLRFADGILRAEDDLFSTMVMYHAKSVKAVDLCCYVYRIRQSSITTTVNINRWYDSLRVQEMLADFFVPLKGIDKSVIYRVFASGYIGWFSSTTKKLYGNRDKELKARINWNHFKQTAVTKRHKRLYRLIRISPKLFRLYSKLTQKIHK
ncbi:MAG: glycosyltransferase [Bacteroidales bacterium]|nr:glycosyltransferase [Bacteroidales bacterium]